MIGNTRPLSRNPVPPLHKMTINDRCTRLDIHFIEESRPPQRSSPDQHTCTCARAAAHFYQPLSLVVSPSSPPPGRPQFRERARHALVRRVAGGVLAPRPLAAGPHADGLWSRQKLRRPPQRTRLHWQGPGLQGEWLAQLRRLCSRRGRVVTVRGCAFGTVRLRLLSWEGFVHLASLLGAFHPPPLSLRRESRSTSATTRTQPFDSTDADSISDASREINQG